MWQEDCHEFEDSLDNIASWRQAGEISKDPVSKHQQNKNNYLKGLFTDSVILVALGYRHGLCTTLAIHEIIMFNTLKRVTQTARLFVLHVYGAVWEAECLALSRTISANALIALSFERST